VYKKGAGVVHTLRNFMGDSAFFKGCKDYLSTYVYRSANSNDLSNALTLSSGINTSRFFQDWVFTQGFPHFSIDSTKTEKKANLFEVTIYTRQRQKGNTHIYQMPVECQLTNGTNDTTVTLPIDNSTNMFKVLLPFNPLWIALDRAEKMADATVDYEKVITTVGNNTFLETNTSVNVTNAGTGPSTLRVEHDFVRPDGFKVNKDIRVSDYHYWTVDGLISKDFAAQATFTYDGSNSTSTGYLDNTFIRGNEDSLVFLYRPNAGKDWEVVKGIKHNKGNSNDKRGSFTLDTLKFGEYTLGINSKFSSIAGPLTIDKSVFLNPFPNPVVKEDVCTIRFGMGNTNDGLLTVLDIQGKEVWHSQVFAHQEFVTWDTFGMASGTYIIQLSVGGKPIKSSQIEICR
jgi:aminopeptidase N